MAFTNLFAGLIHVDQDVTHRSFGEKDKRTRQTEHTGPGNKRQRYEAQETWTYNTKPFPSGSSDKQDKRYNSERGRSHHHSENKAGHSDMCHKGPRAPRNYRQRQQQQQQQYHNKGVYQKRQHQFRGRGAHHYGSGRNYREQRRSYQSNQQRPQVPYVKTFSQEFKDQNALLLDGELLCRHFLWGRCIKGDECQLKHIQSCNDLIKEVCKYYIQGCCTKGESCPYMHNSIPCKFFHRGGKCSQEAECRFSHEPLNETTSQLLDKVLQRENELANKAKLESQEQLVSTEEPETELNNFPDVLTQPLRPNFYNKEETSSEPESLSCKTEERSEVTEAEPEVSAQPHGPPSPPLGPEEPVCYSVEALLGSQQFKPFPSFSTTPAPGESPSERTPQSKAPYSVGPCADPAAQSESSALLCDAAPRSDKGRVPLYSPLIRTEMNEPQEKMFKCLPSLQTRTERKQPGEVSASSYGFMPGLYSLPTSGAEFVTSGRKGNAKLPVETSQAVKSENVLPFAASELRGQTCTSTHPGSTSQPQASEKHRPPPPPPPLSSSHLSEIKAPVESVASSTKTNIAGVYCFAAKPPTECPKPPGLRPGAQQSQCRGDRILNRAFYNLFADDLKTSPDLTTATSRPRSSSSSSSSSSSLLALTRSSDLKPEAEPDSMSDRPFFSLFAAPLSSPPPSRPHASTAASGSQASDLSSEHESGSKQRASNTETSPPPPVKQEIQQTPHGSTYPKVSPYLKNGNDLSKTESRATEEGNRTFRSCTPAPHGDGADPSSTQAHQRLLHTSSPEGCAVAAAQSSVLKTLFLCLNPFEDDAEQQDAGNPALPPGREIKEKKSIWVVDEEQQQKERKEKKTQQRLHLPTEDSVATCTQQPPSPQTPPLSVEATAGPTLNTTATPGPQVRECGTHKLPFRPVTLLMQRHTQRRAEERKNVAGVPLKDLFKTLDTSVFK